MNFPRKSAFLLITPLISVSALFASPALAASKCLDLNEINANLVQAAQAGHPYRSRFDCNDVLDIDDLNREQMSGIIAHCRKEERNAVYQLTMFKQIGCEELVVSPGFLNLPDYHYKITDYTPSHLSFELQHPNSAYDGRIFEFDLVKRKVIKWKVTTLEKIMNSTSRDVTQISYLSWGVTDPVVIPPSKHLKAMEEFVSHHDDEDEDN